MISLDTETTGLDFKHGTKPFLVTTCDEEGNVKFWEWDVDPLTREPLFNEDDLYEIVELYESHDEIVLHNSMFDVRALNTLHPMFGDDWPWEYTHDTMFCSHVVRSNARHNLTDLTLRYLFEDVEPYELKIKEACNKARRIARSKYPDWRIAKSGMPDMPSARESCWKFDMWLPRAIAKEENYPDDHPWWTLCSEYANVDSTVTIELFKVLMKEIEARGLTEIYNTRLGLLRIVYLMEEHGITCNEYRLDELSDDYKKDSREFGRICENIAKSYNYDLELPKSGNNKSLNTFLFDVLKLPVVKRSKKTKDPAFDKAAVGIYLETLPRNSKQLSFVRNLSKKRRRDTGVSYMDSYRKFWVDAGDSCGTKLLYPSVNPVATDTLRWASQRPNEQNISNQKLDDDDRNLRYCFGPAPGREWWSLDYDNLELRIPAYESGEPAMLKLFEQPNDPPYFGSYHLLVFDLLHPEKFAKHGTKVKDIFKSTWYQWTKNGNFADMYGAMEESGTADRAYHVPGAQRIVAERLTEKAKLNQYWIDFADKHGYVETMVDKSIGSKRGYPLYCPSNDFGIRPTTPLNYHVQGTACWVVMMAMLKIQEYFDELNSRLDRPEYFIIMNIHDEVVLDMPFKPNMGNKPKARKVRKLMESCGDDIGVRLTCGLDYHSSTWNKGVSL